MIAARILPIADETTFHECAQAAATAGMFLITNGQKVVVSPIVPPGFAKIVLRVKRPDFARVEVQPCAA